MATNALFARATLSTYAIISFSLFPPISVSISDCASTCGANREVKYKASREREQQVSKGKCGATYASKAPNEGERTQGGGTRW